MTPPVYLNLIPGAKLPEVTALAPFRAVVVIVNAVSRAFQCQVSEWLVKSGCLYMLAWGPNCSSWDDSVDEANLAEFHYGEIPDERFVMTTWHENASLSEVFDFCKRHARHPTVDLRNTLLLHIAESGDRDRLLQEYGAA